MDCKKRGEEDEGMTERPYQKLVAWREAYALSLWIYNMSKSFPPEERFGLTDQIRRACSSVPINIAEGNTKRSRKERAHFFEISLASLNEVDCELMLAKDLGYISQESYAIGIDKIQRASFLLTRLLQSVRSPLRVPRPPRVH
jgi:four helix bundle protein